MISQDEKKVRNRAAVKKYAELNSKKLSEKSRNRYLASRSVMTDFELALFNSKRSARHAQRMLDPDFRERQRLASVEKRSRDRLDPAKLDRKRYLDRQRYARLNQSVPEDLVPSSVVRRVANSVFSWAGF